MSQPSSNWKLYSVIITGALVSLIVVAAIVFYSYTLSTQGSIGSVKSVNCTIYSDAAATQKLTYINWGTLPPDSSVNYTIYIKNTGNTPCNWTYSLGNWLPANANSYVYASIDFKGAVNTVPAQVIQAVITDSVLANAPVNTNYSYDIIVTASG